MSRVDQITITGENWAGLPTATDCNRHEYERDMHRVWWRKVQKGLYMKISNHKNQVLNAAYERWLKAQEGVRDGE